jgi:hypothetical protein
MVEMQRPRHAQASLDADLARLAQEHLVEIHLDDLEGLLQEPGTGPFASRRSPYRAGIDDLALTLSAAQRLPDELTVRVVLPPGTSPTVTTEPAQAAMQQVARDSASVSWREAMAVRSMGRRQFPFGITIALVAALIAYGSGYLASVVDNVPVRGLLLAMFGVAITVAWVFSWMVVEAAFIDWRQPARKAHAFDLLAHATLEVVDESSATITREA